MSGKNERTWSGPTELSVVGGGPSEKEFTLYISMGNWRDTGDKVFRSCERVCKYVGEVYR